MLEHETFMKYFTAQANDNETLVQQLLREYEKNDRDERDRDDRDWLRRLASNV